MVCLSIFATAFKWLGANPWKTELRQAFRSKEFVARLGRLPESEPAFATAGKSVYR
jgi:hypothetical protein